MIGGNLFSPSSRGIYWLPLNADLTSLTVSERKVEENGGVILGSVKRIGFISENRPITHYCKSCNILITENNM
jgi:hypothetical protein